MNPSKLTGNGGRLPPLVALAVLLTLSEGSLSALTAGGGTAEAERLGDRWSTKAAASYRKAVEAWTEAEAAATRSAQSPGASLAARARRWRHALRLTLRDPEAWTEHALSAELAEVPPHVLAWPAPDPSSPETPVSSAGSTPTESDLQELVRFFSRAGKAYFLDPLREEREVVLLFEALALAHRLQGDLYQARGDSAYRSALSLAAGDAAAAKLRLLVKLRDFNRAHRLVASGALNGVLGPPADTPQGLAGGAEKPDKRELYELLLAARDAARYVGDAALTLELGRRLKSLNLGRGEEQPGAFAPLPTFVEGGAADLARTARTLIAARTSLRLEPRESSLAGYLAAVATLEAGRPALAADLFGHVEIDSCGGAWLRAQVLARAAEARERSGDYEGALDSYQRARAELAAQRGVGDFSARVDLNTAGVLLQLGHLEGARELAAGVLTTKSTPPELAVRARLFLGDVLYFTPADGPAAERRLVNDARAAYEQALATLASARRDDGRSEDLESQIRIHLGNAEERLARLSPVDASAATAHRRRAVDHAREALRIASDGGPTLARLAAVAAANLGELYLLLGEPDSAREFCEWALSRAEALRAFETTWRARWYLGRVADQRGDTATADREFAAAAAAIEQHRGRILDAELKIGYMSSKQRFFEELVRRSLARGERERAFEIAERARSRAFIESLGLRFLLFAADRDREVYREYVDLLGRAEQERQSRGKLLGVPHGSAGGYDGLRAKIDALRARVHASSDVSPSVKALVEGAAADVATVQAGLAEDEALIEYVSTGESLVAFVVGARVFDVVSLPASPTELAGRIDVFARTQAGDPKLATELHGVLIAPLSRALPPVESARRVTVVPWGPLHRLPFEALRLPSGGFLIEQWEIAYLPSASVLRYVRRERADATPSRLVAFVDPDTDYDRDGTPDFPRLPFAKTEVEAIVPLFKENVVLEGAQALEDACAKLTGAADVVHLACHGEFFPSRPLDSALYLSRGADADGRLRAAEVFGIDFRRSRLVTLSGCETGRIDVGPGDDPIGLGTAFLHSGARALLVSLWKVEDEATATLMKSFYSKWLKATPGDRARALRLAKLEMIRNGTFALPRQWAAFVLIGLR